MKKLLLLPLILLSFLLLTSCSNEPNLTYVKDFEGKEMYNSWLKDVEFNTEEIVINPDQKPSAKETRFEIFLPKNIVEGVRYTTDSIEDFYDERIESTSITAYSFTNLMQYQEYIKNTVNSQSKTIVEALNAKTTEDGVEYPGLDLPEKYLINWTLTFDKKTLEGFAAKEGFSRGVVTAYLPIKLDLYQAVKDKDAQIVLTTYAILPIKTELTYLVKSGEGENAKYNLDKGSVYNKFDSFDLLQKSGLLA